MGRKYGILLVAVMLVLLLCGCSGKHEDNQNDASLELDESKTATDKTQKLITVKQFQN